MQDNYSITLYEFNLINILFLVAIMTFNNAIFFIYYMEHGFHRFIICNTLRIIAFDDSLKFVGCNDFFFSTTS